MQDNSGAELSDFASFYLLPFSPRSWDVLVYGVNFTRQDLLQRQLFSSQYWQASICKEKIVAFFLVVSSP
jgi:hypothetical protein